MGRFRMQVYCCMLLNNLIEPCVTAENQIAIRDILSARLHQLLEGRVSDPVKQDYGACIDRFASGKMQRTDKTYLGSIIEHLYQQISFETSSNSVEYESKCAEFVPLGQMDPGYDTIPVHHVSLEDLMSR